MRGVILAALLMIAGPAWAQQEDQEVLEGVEVLIDFEAHLGKSISMKGCYLSTTNVVGLVQCIIVNSRGAKIGAVYMSRSHVPSEFFRHVYQNCQGEELRNNCRAAVRGNLIMSRENQLHIVGNNVQIRLDGNILTLRSRELLTRGLQYENVSIQISCAIVSVGSDHLICNIPIDGMLSDSEALWSRAIRIEKEGVLSHELTLAIQCMCLVNVSGVLHVDTRRRFFYFRRATIAG